ncbi:MAG: mechanosensitive ion channel [Candidatus Cloacimonetes bacterium]|nr:mechanosensitive ion channel [Candidatus Cloacimonadota bacterium]
MINEQTISQLSKMAVEYGLKLLGAVAVWIIGAWIIKAIMNALCKTMDKRNTDESLKPFLRSIVGMLLKIMLAISVLRMLGIEMTSFIAILAAMGLAVGMALSGMLQNFAGGVMIMIFKPFKVGDVIDAQGYTGAVHEIQILNTSLKTLDNKVIIIPNGGLSTSPLTNFTTEKRRRVDWTIAIGYGDSVDKAKEVLRKLCDEDTRIMKDPEVFIAVSELADSSVNLIVGAWVDTADYWAVFFEMNEKVYKTFGEEGLHIPYPQMDVHLHKDA